MSTSPTERILILGAGRFGSLAAERLRHRRKSADIVVVDRDVRREGRLAALGCTLVTADGIDYLVDAMQPAPLFGWIVPALPLHVAWLWLRRDLAAGKRTVVDLAVPQPVEALVPHPLRGDHGQLYASNADFLCPDDCSEPERFCTLTGKPRPVVMFSHLAALRVPGFTPVVIRSRQLAPGVGGYPPAALRQAEAACLAAPGSVLLATACKCHAVIDAFRIDRPATVPR